MFGSLRRWKPSAWSGHAQPVEATLRAMDEAGVAVGLLCAWWGPSGPLIGNDEVAKLCSVHPGRFVGVASVDLYRPAPLRHRPTRVRLPVAAGTAKSAVLSLAQSRVAA